MKSLTPAAVLSCGVSARSKWPSSLGNASAADAVRLLRIDP
jgi:hypothetical protein